ncbi:hypothetical protein FSF01_09625 [Listeria monocytogenes]|uniref:Uncharacterized protein n=1 Tax=Listeria monocytogenes TaxID=1639 RepID=A0A5Y9DNG3_LISMN|nr:hypothetical protein [Listeria monocytogenes]EAD6490785.1 hypothetical protein [Listeria monocytogenes]EAE3693077.1 hypothetical protein [Listeria monocytogenes]EAE5958582.1 hypothetical protein [Listeria monocytogenes]EAE5967183.1 hypothetical protein [Listeria monocytogenes]
MKPCPLIIAPHAFSFCERFVKLCLGNRLKHVFYVSILSTFSLKNKKNTLTEKIKVFLNLIST